MQLYIVDHHWKECGDSSTLLERSNQRQHTTTEIKRQRATPVSVYRRKELTTIILLVLNTTTNQQFGAPDTHNDNDAYIYFGSPKG